MVEGKHHDHMNLYWGDVHNHCGISYGYGSLGNALVAAREQLDFCSVTGHASWHDMPKDIDALEFVIAYHSKGFRKLADNWDGIRETVEAANTPHEFVTFHSYEAHSCQYGDYHLLSPSPELPLIEGCSPQGLVSQIKPTPAIAVPHHVAYAPGYRGIMWAHFEGTVSPIVEVYSKHGCGLSDRSPYPYYHTMGPRDSRTTVRAGMALGHRFGFVASTDHHAGYPGSYGDGRVAVLATEKSRKAIWDAILARRTYAVTGDKIACRFCVNGRQMGSEFGSDGTRELELHVRGCDSFDKIIVYKNLLPWKTICGEPVVADSQSGPFRVRLEMGWGSSPTEFAWLGTVHVTDGVLDSVEPCFRGQSVLAPSQDRSDDPGANALDNRILHSDEASVEFQSVTFRNPTTRHPQTSAIVLEISGDDKTVLAFDLNGRKAEYSIGELLDGARSMQLHSYSAEAFLVRRAVPEAEYRFYAEWTDTESGQECDVYDVEIRQANGQCAWLSPVYVLS